MTFNSISELEKHEKKHELDLGSSNDQEFYTLDTSYSLDSPFQGIALVNKANSCYVNSTVNALLSSNILRNKIMSSNESDRVVTKLKYVAVSNRICDVQSLKEINEEFNNHYQHDACLFF